MDKRLQGLLASQQAKQDAEEAIRGISGLSTNTQRGTFLVSNFGPRDDLPASASQRRMTTVVAKNLAEMGFREPVSLRSFPDRWWKVNIDAAEVGLWSEYGAAKVTRILSTAQFMDLGYEVVDGPFRPWDNDEVSKAILERNLGKFWDARVYSVTPKPGLNGQSHFSGADNGYTSEALMAALDQGESIQVFSGPYATADDAHYALDVRWEVPDCD